MARLTAQEESLLKKLMSKREAPEAPQAQRSISISVDLGDEKAVARALSLGILEPADVEENSDDGEGNGDGDDESQNQDDTPRRRGYFRD